MTSTLHVTTDRYVGNIFVGGDAGAAYGQGSEAAGLAVGGTTGYDGHPASFEEHRARILVGEPKEHDRPAAAGLLAGLTPGTNRVRVW